MLSCLACRCMLIAIVHRRAKSDVREMIDENRFESIVPMRVPESCLTPGMGILALCSGYRQTKKIDTVRLSMVKILRSKEEDDP